MSYEKTIIVTVDPNFEAEDGSPFDAVVDALQHFEIPASLVEVDNRGVYAVVNSSDGDVILLANREDADEFCNQCPAYTVRNLPVHKDIQDLLESAGMSTTLKG